MKITACPICGSRKIFQGRLKEGVLTGYSNIDVCQDCGYRGSPIIFDSENEYKKFLDNIDKKDKIKDSERVDEANNLSEKDKEVIKFLNEIKEETDKEEDPLEHNEKRSKILKNPLTSLGFALFIVGILVTFITYFFTIIFILAGIFLFFIGFIGPSREALQNEQNKEKMKKLPKIAGLLLIINGLLNGGLYCILLFYDQMYGVITDTSNYAILVILSIELIFCIMLVIGGLFSFKNKKWGIAILGSILGLLLVPYPFGIPNIVSFLCLILIAYSRFIFKN